MFDTGMDEIESNLAREVSYFNTARVAAVETEQNYRPDYAWSNGVVEGQHETPDALMGGYMQQYSVEEAPVVNKMSSEDAASINAAVARAQDCVVPGSEDSPCLGLLRSVKEPSFRRRNLSLQDKMRPAQLTCVTGRRTEAGTAVVTPKRPVDYALSLGRSFRVGWARDGRFAHSGSAALASGDVGVVLGQVTVETVAAQSRTSSSSHDAFLNTLRSLQRYCCREESPPSSSAPSSSAAAPLWAAPRAVPDSPAEYRRFAEMLKELHRGLAAYVPTPEACAGEGARLRDYFFIMAQMVSLVDSMYGQEGHFILGNPLYTFLPLYSHVDDPSVAAARRRNFISEWLRSVSTVTVSADSPQQHQWSVYRLIFNDLASGRVDAAMHKAAEADLFRLASNISQATTDKYARRFLEQQVATWMSVPEGYDGSPGKGLEGSNGSFDTDLMDVYRLLAGFLGAIECLDDHSWLRALASIFWYRSSGIEDGDDRVGLPVQLHQAFHYYNVSLDEGAVQHPDSPGGVTYGDSNVHALYSILGVLLTDAGAGVGAGAGAGAGADAMSDGDDDVLPAHLLTALESGAFSDKPLDYSGPLLAHILLACVGRSSGLARHTAIVRQHVISQLLCHGEWGLAVFVASLIEDPGVRSSSVRDITLRWADLRVNSASAFDAGASKQQLMLGNTRDTLHVPLAWFHEATSYACASAMDPFQQALHLSQCAPALRRSVGPLVCCDLFARLDLAVHAPALKSLVNDTVLSGSIRQDRWTRTCAVISDYLVFQEEMAAAQQRAVPPSVAAVERAKRLLCDMNGLQLWSSIPCLGDVERKRGRARLQEMGREVHAFLFGARRVDEVQVLSGIRDPIPLGREAQLASLARLNRSFLRAELSMVN